MDFDFDFTQAKVAKLLPTNKDSAKWYVALRNNLPASDINTVLRVAAFISQTAHESAEYTKLHEILDYRATGLLATWPKRFDAVTAAEYAHKPEKIANKVYANRNGNGDAASGEGYKFRGRGPIQLTGKDNYRRCSLAMYGDERLLATPELIEDDADAAIKSACWYWTVNKLNRFADTGDIRELTRGINGGYIGLDERKLRYQKALSILQSA